MCAYFWCPVESSIFFFHFLPGSLFICSASLSVVSVFHIKYQIFINMFLKITCCSQNSDSTNNWDTQYFQLHYFLFSFSFSSISYQFFTEKKSHYPSRCSRILAVTLQPNLTHNLSQFHGSLCLSDWETDTKYPAYLITTVTSQRPPYKNNTQLVGQN